jgi:polyisoprenyl-teichoic acid--peptidoglycan teichoic acid transferase
MRLVPGSRRGALARFAIGAVIVIAFTATTTAVAGLLQFKQFAADLSLTPALKAPQVTIANPGNPQTLLLIGSDHRAGEPFSAANTDTMMLVRLDPNSSTINVLSVPRDLRVLLPQGGASVPGKLNAAYSIGGPNLLVKVLKQQVFPGLQINHIIDVNFGGFEALVNAIGCVYTDVDHRYYNNTAYTDYSSIDVQPGYQKLCGSDALAFVRFRHTDTDIVRNARQQDFLRWAKDQYGASQLIANRDTLLRLFGQHTQTDRDLHTVDGLINLFNLVAFSAGHQIKQIPFPAILVPCAPLRPTANAAAQQTPCYVGADPGPEHHAFAVFMTPTAGQATPSPPPASGGSHPGGGNGKPASPGPASNLTADPSDGQSQAAALGGIGLPIYVPRVIAAQSHYCTNGTCTIGPQPNSYPRAYQMHDQSGNAYSAYRITLARNTNLGEYYGVEGTTWKDPPILKSPTQTRNVGGKQLELFFNGHQLSVAAWRTSQAVYWISNTLRDDLSNQQMIGIAASLMRAG